MSFWDWFKKPKPKPPTPPPPREVHLSVFGNGQLVADKVTYATLTPNTDPPTPPLDVVPFSDHGSPRLRSILPATVQYGWGADLRVDVPGFESYQQKVLLAPDLDIGLTPEVMALPRLIPRGQFFALATGEPFTAIECSDFKLYERFLGGEDLSNLLSQRAALGFNMVRVFGMGIITFSNGDTMRLVPQELGDRYYTQLAPFYQLLAKHGLYGEWTAFAAASRTMPNAADQVAYWGRLCSIFPGISNALVELVNEADQADNTLVSLPKLLAPTDVVASHGSNGSQVWPVSPYWNYCTMHFNDASEWPRKVGHNAMEVWNGPTLANENTRAPDHLTAKGQAYDAAAGAALLCAGSCFHSTSGRVSALWTGLELELAKAWADGARSVPLHCQPGAYGHGQDMTDLEQREDLLRAYRRGADPQCIVKIHK